MLMSLISQKPFDKYRLNTKVVLFESKQYKKQEKNNKKNFWQSAQYTIDAVYLKNIDFTKSALKLQK